MDSLRTIKTRLRAVGNISQITKAMEVVSATKMRRAQEVALHSRPYALKALEILGKIAKNAPFSIPFTEARPVKTTLVLVVASDRGLAGSFNTQVFRAADKLLASLAEESRTVLLATVGKKAFRYATKKKLERGRAFFGHGDYVEAEEVEPLAEFLVRGFEEGKWDRVLTISTHFRSVLRQEVLVRQILPVEVERIREAVRELVPERGRYAWLGNESGAEGAVGEEAEYIFEPTPEEALRSLVPQLVTMQIYHLILEANASEHSARRVAMKNASDNAVKLEGTLTRAAHKARQAGITKELVEITATQSALGA